MEIALSAVVRVRKGIDLKNLVAEAAESHCGAELLGILVRIGEKILGTRLAERERHRKGLLFMATLQESQDSVLLPVVESILFC